ncbi:MAG TPA: oxidoreductase [Ruminococcaceae bacterium]|nr:oxidoreductase [Oscillospiraceae bacterium]
MINVAIVGTGNISPMHIKGYLEFGEKCRIVALVDIYPQKAHDKNGEFNLKAQVYDSHLELLNRKDIDLVSICTPPYTHAQIAIDFLNAGMNVLVEKPMAASLEECDTMIKAANRSGKNLAMIAQNRFRTTIMSLKNLLDNNAIGKVLYAQIDSLWWRGHSYYDLWWRGCWDKEGGGCTLNHAVHHIDMLCWMMGMPQKVTSVLGNVAHDNAEVEDISIAVLQYSNGALGQITSSVIHHGEEQGLLFQGEQAGVSVPFKVFAAKEQSNGFPDKNTELEDKIKLLFEQYPTLLYEGHTGEIQNVLNALEKGIAPLIQGIDGRKTVEMITAIYKAGFTEAPVKLPILPDDEWYTAEGILSNVKHFHEKSTSVENFDNGNITVGSNY